MRILSNIVLWLVMAPLRALYGVFHLLFGFKPHFRKGRRRFNNEHETYIVARKKDNYFAGSFSTKNKFGDNIELSRRIDRKPGKQFVQPYLFESNKNNFKKKKSRGYKKISKKDKKITEKLPRTKKTPNEIYREKLDKNDK